MILPWGRETRLFGRKTDVKWPANKLKETYTRFAELQINPNTKRAIAEVLRYLNPQILNPKR